MGGFVPASVLTLAVIALGISYPRNDNLIRLADLKTTQCKLITTQDEVVKEMEN